MANKFYEAEMAAINNQISTMASMVATGNATLNQYKAERISLNLHIIQVLVGCTIVEKNGSRKVKFNKPLPTKEQIANVAKVVQNFINTVECKIMKATGEDEEDLAIPVSAGIPDIEKCNNKKLAANILGTDTVSISTLPINGVDCMQLAAFGEEARKKRNTKLAIIIAGCVVVAAVGTTVAVLTIKKKKEKDEEAELNETFIDEEIDDVPEVSVDSFRGIEASAIDKFSGIEAGVLESF